ncbi:MAG TPA: 23S rRNA (uracil(1939)-C(5))-methyltransferase RlmD [Thiohalobacter sp.]|nr:23S rRNA (uracil(1939)-C(5))-methyltransferase RlmD [Thiohalobacter sp.]
MARRSKPLPPDPVPAHIDSLSHDGRGVAHPDGKAVFIDGALPGERVTFIYTGKHRSYDEGRVEAVLEPAPERVVPRCSAAGVCGGCSLQHMDPGAQIQAKQGVLLENLKRIGGVEPETVLPPLTGPVWGYRHKARLGVKYVRRKDEVLVGFREKRKPFVARIEHCEVLHPDVGYRLRDLALLIDSLSIKAAVPQIEVAVGDRVTALVFRVLEAPSESDLASLRAFGQEYGMQIHLQPKGPDSVALLWPESAAAARTLSYDLDDHQITLQFRPTDFTQINPEINQRMIAHALELLQPQADSRVLDLFCGLGNFTLPLARRVAGVTGVEGEAGLVARARENARANGIDNAEFFSADLAGEVTGEPWLARGYDRVLLDPPRSGAKELIPQIAARGAQRIVYVACQPGSLARDAGLLVSEYGYRLAAAGVMDMFPHTAHVESIALFLAPG